MRKVNNIWRKIIQWSVISLIAIFAAINALNPSFDVDFEAYCPFGGLQSLGSYLINEALSCTMTGVQIVMGITLILGVLLFSKLFCAFICPIGTLTEWLSKIGQKLKIQLEISTGIDLALRALKYILLFITLYFTLQSNELFCKKFDPYYGITSGFDSDVIVWWSISAIAIVVLGSMFFRLFWCKYLCPLGAISNIFKFTGLFAGVLIFYIILLKLGLNISYVWPLAAACIGAYSIELSRRYGRFFPIVKVSRNVDNCTHCSLCSKKCPQAIDVANLRVVKNADCNLCGDCVSACPEPNTLQFSEKKKFKYLPHLATIALVLTGMLIGQFWHIPTINERWYDVYAYEDVRSYERSGLSTVKCYGSSTAFANRMRQVDGVLGVSTYVDTKTAKIYYDGTKLSERAIERLIFTPQKLILRKLKKEDTQDITKVHVTLEDFFDKNDFNYLARFLQDNTKAIGILSEYACPVIVEVFFRTADTPSKEELRELFETKSFTYTYQEKEHSAEMAYEVVDGPILAPIKSKEYIKIMFTPVDFQFNRKSVYSKDVLKEYIIPSPITSQNNEKIKYLISHISNDKGIVSFRNYIDSAMNEQINITYVDSLTNSENIIRALTNDTLFFNYRDGRQGKIINMFEFEMKEPLN